MTSKKNKKIKRLSKRFYSKKNLRCRPVFGALFAFSLIAGGAMLYLFHAGYIFPEQKAQPIIPFDQQDWYKAKIKIGLINDAHLESGMTSKGKYFLTKESRNKIVYFVNEMENDFHPDVVVSGGDMIEGTRWAKKQSFDAIAETEDLMNLISAPKMHVLGNHDIRAITKDEWKEAAKVNYFHTVMDIGKYRIITVDSNFQADGSDVVPKNQFIRGNIPDNELNWVEQQLSGAAPDQIKLVFLHHPPLTYLPDKKPIWLLKGADKLQKIFEKYNVAAVFAGHIQYLYHEKINGVNYFLFPGMEKSAGHPDSFAEIEMTRRKPTVTLVQKNAKGEYESFQME